MQDWTKYKEKKQAYNKKYYEANKDLQNNKELSNELNSICDDKYVKIDMNEFSDNSWIFANKSSLEIMKKINGCNGKQAKEIFEGIYKGITSGDNKVFCIKDGIEDGEYIIGYSVAIEQKVKLEKKIVKKLLVGDSLKKYEINYNNDYIIYPYKKENGKCL